MVRATASFALASSATSTLNPCARPPLSAMARATLSALAGSRSATATSAPSSAKRRAIAPPISPPPPVISATRPASLPVMVARLARTRRGNYTVGGALPAKADVAIGTAMQFGIWTPLPHTIRPEPRMDAAVAEIKADGPLNGRRDDTFGFACDVVRRADELGFDTTLIAERYLGPDLSAWVLASALAMVTKRIELMVAVHPGMVTPQVVAKMGSSLDRISGGRAALNIVNGWWMEEFDLFSNGTWIGDAERYPRMGEYIQVIKGLWTDSDFDFDGAHYRAHVRAAMTGADGKVVMPTAGDIVARPVQSPHPPIYAASRSPGGRELIAQHCDVWFAEYKPGFRNFESNIERMAADVRAMSDLAAQYGRKLRYAINPQVICCETQAQAERLADDAERNAGPRDRMVNALGAGLVGTPELLADRLRRYEEIGLDTMMTRFTPMLEGVEMFGSQVIPLLRR
jgi:FMNH2-dependent dimethyl sulfone monooxygenase